MTTSDRIRVTRINVDVSKKPIIHYLLKEFSSININSISAKAKTPQKISKNSITRSYK